jgi:enoyl-CoA hydratase/carnithine racemase
MKIEEEMFSAETVEPGIVMVRQKRHLVEHMTFLSQKDAFFKFLDRIEADESCKCLIILGHPEKRGEAEFAEWHERIRKMQRDQFTLERIVNAFQQHVRRILTLPQIVLFGDSGALTSSYLSIGLAADHFALGEDACFHNAQAKFDHLAPGGTPFLLKERIGKTQALQLLLNYNRLPAEKARSLGICDHVCPPEELESYLLEKARELTRHQRSYLNSIKIGMRPDLPRLDAWLERELMLVLKQATDG